MLENGEAKTFPKGRKEGLLPGGDGPGEAGWNPKTVWGWGVKGGM